MSLRRRTAQILRQRLSGYLNRNQPSVVSGEVDGSGRAIPEQQSPPADGTRAEALRVLDVPADASDNEIRSAYLRLCKEFHPDRFRDDERKRRLADQLLAEVNAAYSTLRRK